MLHLGFVRILSYGRGGTLPLASPCRPPYMPTLAGHRHKYPRVGIRPRKTGQAGAARLS